MEKVKHIEIPLKEDERGWVVWPIENTELEKRRLCNVHLPFLRPGAVRGNHYHRKTIEYTLILSGPTLAVFEDNRSGERKEELIRGDRPVLFRIEADVTHAFKNQSPHAVYLLCYEQRDEDHEEHDIYRKTILL